VLDATAETLCSAGNLGTAEACWKEQASLCQRRGDSRGLAACSQNLGHVAYQQGRFDEALRHYKEQERLNREIADEGGIASALANQGAAGTKLGLASAAALLLEAHRLLPDDAAIPYNLACCCVRSGELDEAEAWIKKAIEIAGDSAAITREALADDDLADIRPRLARF
jgi:tetratricopeptide (TPR) repeat protein